MALDRATRPDHVDLFAIPLAEGAPTDPRWWAGQVFAIGATPLWVRVLFGLRQALVPLIGLGRSPGDVFAVREVVGEEALIVAEDRHLDFWCAVGVDPVARLLRVTTVVTLHGWRGRVYWGVVRFFHGPVVTSMLRRAVRADPC